MSCMKKGTCTSDQKVWCRGYTCENHTIVKDQSKRQTGDPCSNSNDCQSNICEKLECDSLKSIGIPQAICENMGICVLITPSISNSADF